MEGNLREIRLNLRRQEKLQKAAKDQDQQRSSFDVSASNSKTVAALAAAAAAALDAHEEMTTEEIVAAVKRMSYLDHATYISRPAEHKIRPFTAFATRAQPSMSSVAWVQTERIYNSRRTRSAMPSLKHGTPGRVR